MYCSILVLKDYFSELRDLTELSNFLILSFVLTFYFLNIYKSFCKLSLSLTFSEYFDYIYFKLFLRLINSDDEAPDVGGMLLLFSYFDINIP